MSKTPHRTVRIPDEEWQAATEAAAANGTNVTEVIRAALRRYVRRTKAKAGPPTALLVSLVILAAFLAGACARVQEGTASAPAAPVADREPACTPTGQGCRRADERAPELVAFAFDNTEMAARGYRLSGPAMTPLPAAPLAPPNRAYGLRDPSVVRIGGTYYLAATKARRAAYLGTGATHLQLFASPDLANWTPLPDVPADVPGAGRAWAPELFVDEHGVYLYYAVSTDTTQDAAKIRGFAIYARQALDTTLTRWGAPVLQAGLVTPKVIDPHVTRIDDPRGAYVMFYKDETAMRICRAWADSPLGPWRTDRTGDWLGDGTPTEGPQLVRLPSSGWRLFTDRYAANHLTYRDSRDLDTWTAPTLLTYEPTSLRHPGYLWL